MDIAVIVGVLVASVMLYRPTRDPRYTMAALVAALLFFPLAEIAGLYRPWRGETLKRQFFQILFVWAVPDYFTTSLFHGKWSNLEGIPLISVYDTPFRGVDGWVKRAEDVVLSILILLAIAIPMLLIAAAVKLSSPGAVLFTQRRYGMDGNEIGVWKFRTMRVCEDGDEVPQAKKNDPRVTKLGTFLRRTSLDELP